MAAPLSQSVPAAGAAELGENVVRVEASEVACGLRWTWDLSGDNLRNRTGRRDDHPGLPYRLRAADERGARRPPHPGRPPRRRRDLGLLDRAGRRQRLGGRSPSTASPAPSTSRGACRSSASPAMARAGSDLEPDLRRAPRVTWATPPRDPLRRDFARYGIIPGVESTLHYLNGVGGPVAYSTVVRTLPTTTSLTLVHRAAGDGTDVAYATDVSPNASCANVVLDDADDGDAVTDNEALPGHGLGRTPRRRRCPPASASTQRPARAEPTPGRWPAARSRSRSAPTSTSPARSTSSSRPCSSASTSSWRAAISRRRRPGRRRRCATCSSPAQALAEAARLAQACEQYEQAYLRTDGADEAEDFVTGLGRQRWRPRSRRR